MHRQRMGGGYTALTIGLLAAFCIVALSASPAIAEDPSASMLAYESLAREFAQLRDTGPETLSPQELADACDDLIADLDAMIDGASADPNAESKAQKLLHKVYDFAGMEPEAKVAYGQYLDTLESWKGIDYAALVVGRAVAREHDHREYTRACVYFDIFAAKYPGNSELTEARYFAGLSYIELKDYEAAAAHFRAVIATDDNNLWIPKSYRKLAFVQLLNKPTDGPYDDAMATLQEMIVKFPNTIYAPYARYRRGQILERSDKKLEALAEYLRVMDDYPSGGLYVHKAKKAVARLQEEIELDNLDELFME